MKTIIGSIFCFVILFNCSVSYAEKIIVATGEWIPFTSKNMENYGEFTKLVSIVFKEMGVEPEYRFYPWRRCYASVVKGFVWAAFPFSHTKERAREVKFTNILSCSRTVFFYYDHDNAQKQYQFEELTDLKNYKVGGVIGYYYEEAFKEAGLAVDYVNKEISGLEKLRLGRIDLMPFNELVGKHLIRNHFPGETSKFKTLPKSMDVSTLHLIVSKKYPRSNELLNRFNAALQSCIGKKLISIPECP